MRSTNRESRAFACRAHAGQRECESHFTQPCVANRINGAELALSINGRREIPRFRTRGTHRARVIPRKRRYSQNLETTSVGEDARRELGDLVVTQVERLEGSLRSGEPRPVHRQDVIVSPVIRKGARLVDAETRGEPPDAR